MKQSEEPTKLDFIHDQKFIEWIIAPDTESSLYWETYLQKNPSRLKEFNQARILIKRIIPKEKEHSKEDIEILWNQIERSGQLERHPSFKIGRWVAAASVVAILSISGWLLQHQNTDKVQNIDYKSIASKVTPTKEIRLIKADKSEKTFDSKVVDLKYDGTGKLETKAGNIISSDDSEGSSDVAMNQLVVPRGKRSSILLSDGTKLFLNSGSRAIYPVVFKQKNREIFIEGEGYLEVAHDASRPFYVVTDQVRVKVLGTKFDISAYKEDDRTSVVLVEGSVEATTPSRTAKLEPNQLLSFSKSSGATTVEPTNILESVSWKDGWMLCNKENMISITTKLSRYYDIRIAYSDQQLNTVTLTGKLDLKNNFEDVFQVICATAPLNYELKDGVVQLKMRK